jgi:triosephosphate isomerase (TIM)
MKADLKNGLVVNFKAYSESTGKKAYELARTCNEVALETGAKIAVAVQATDIASIAQDFDISVFAQHIDSVKCGSATGWILPEAVIDAGACGTLISHSERKLTLEEISQRIGRASDVGLTTIVCSGMRTNDETIEETKAICAMGPDYVAAEPPDMIGGDISVTTKPELVSAVVDAVKNSNPNVGVLTGAGVKTGEDVSDAIRLGTQGVLLASGVVKAKDPRAALMNLCSGLPK